MGNNRILRAVAVWSVTWALLLSLAVAADDIGDILPGTGEDISLPSVTETISEDEATPEDIWAAVRAVRFADVAEDAPFRDALSYAAYRGILIGTGGGHFSPDLLLTRGQTVTLLARICQMGEDVAPISPEDALQWAADTGILKGTTNGYEETALVTRAQFATFLYRLAEYQGHDITVSGDLSIWPDGVTVPAYAAVPIAWATERGIFDGIVTGFLCPELAVSRTQAALAVTGLLAELKGDETARAILAAAVDPAAESVSRANHETIQGYVDATARKYGAIGLQVAVIEKGRVTDTYTYGWATKGTDPMTADHKERIASISKIVMGMEAMKLQEAGVVDLDESIGRYWGMTVKNPYYPNYPVSIRSILSHTSSIALFGDGEPRTYSAVRSRLAGSGFSKVVPGSIRSWGYNNYGFVVLGLTLEQAGAATLDNLLQDAFFDALGIDASFYGGDLNDPGLLVTLYQYDGSVARSVSYQETEFHAGAPASDGKVFPGGLIISAHDLAKLTAILANDGEYEGLRLLSPASVATMETTLGAVSGGFYQGYPLCYRAGIYGRGGLYYHTGSSYGVYNCLSYDPDTGDGVIVLTTGANAAKDRYGIYAVCGEISFYIYNMIAD